ncbi:hypothetical protein JKP88DRAFT_336776 [Tribonema minus]|uniref:Uncharacterized protein n=1 Tax=Tribonema minus TaxID=303371 RepID=A0A835YLF0_9STRA|nr:hypothetical protein JKP88DRAFT_336776 [Tribonema minus]
MSQKQGAQELLPLPIIFEAKTAQHGWPAEARWERLRTSAARYGRALGSALVVSLIMLGYSRTLFMLLHGIVEKASPIHAFRSSSSYNTLQQQRVGIAHRQLLDMAEPSPAMGSLHCPAMAPLKVLCASVVGSTPQVRQNLLRNMLELGDKCDWALISSDSSSDTLATALEEVAAQGVSIVSIQDGRAEDPSLKVLQWPLLRALLSRYQYVWLLDERLSFETFDFATFTAAHSLGFKEGAAIIAHPAVYSAQSVTDETAAKLQHPAHKLNDPNYWRQRQWRRLIRAEPPYDSDYDFDIDVLLQEVEVAAARTAYVSAQAPFINTDFFAFFLDEVLLSEVAIQTGSNWGPDLFWCAAAWEYEKKVTGLERPACVAVPGASLLQLDLEGAQPLNEEKTPQDDDAMQAYGRLYPRWRWTPWRQRKAQRTRVATAQQVLSACADVTYAEVQRKMALAAAKLKIAAERSEWSA